MDKLFKEMSQCIKVFIGTETELDPFEKNVETVLLNPVFINAIVTDLTSTQMSWKSAGIVKEQGIQLIIKKNKKSLIEQSQKIEVNGVDYCGWKTNDKMEIRTNGNYINVYAYRKQV